MISVEQAREKILSYFTVLGKEQVYILNSIGQVLAEDIYSGIDIPPLDNSAMDGYAVQSRDTSSASVKFPRFLHVLGTVVAGSMPQCVVKPGTAVRIMTGAPLPKGSDSVVKFEDTDEAQQKKSSNKQLITEIGILHEAEAGLNIRRAGEDVTKGSLVLKKGTVIRPAEIGVLSSLGMSKVRVVRRPVVAILATGDELVAVGQPLPEGKIYNSNTYCVAALVRRYGGTLNILGIAQDNEDSLLEKFCQSLDADMLITTGGVSAGDYDIVKDVLAKEGEINFWSVRMKPGKPLAFGKLSGQSKNGKNKNIPFLGLPGNPVSSTVTFELFARPAIFKMMGKRNLTKPIIKAVIEEPVINKGGRRFYARAIVEKRNDQYFARLTGPQGSGIMTSMSLANGLVIVPEDKIEVKSGELVQVMMLDWNEEVN